jgi:hypothetical protein
MDNGNDMLQMLEIGTVLETYSKMPSAETACSDELETGSCC